MSRTAAMSARGFTAAEKIDAAEREVRQRERVYPRLVAAGKMSQRFADDQIAVMREIAADYAREARKETLL